MFASFQGRKGLVALVAVLFVLPLRLPTAASPASPAAWQAGGCGPSMQGVERLRADLALDSALANRASSLANSAAGNGQTPAANDVQSLTEDSLDGLNDAGDQLEQATDEITRQLDGMPQQQGAWARGVNDMRTARSSFRSSLRQDPIARGQRIGSTSATGVGPRVTYESAATTYQNSVENLNRIALDGPSNHVARSPGIQQGARDTNPPANPGPDPWQEWLRRMQAQQARIRNNINGLNAARALQGGQFQQAQQLAGNMQAALQDAQGLANQLGQMAALCNQANASQQQQPQSQPQGTPAQPQGAPVNTAPAAGASTGGGGMGAALLIGGLGAAGVVGYAAYQASAASCGPPPFGASFNACLAGNCFSCVSVIEELVPWCDCMEEKGLAEEGLGATCRQELPAMRRQAARCLVPPSSTLLPKGAPRR